MLHLFLLLSCRDKAADDTGPTPDDTSADTPVDTAEEDEATCTYVEGESHGEAGESAFVVATMASGLATPWSVAWLPDGDILMTERDGVISVVSGTTVTQIAAVESVETGEGGLLGLALDPDFATSRAFFVYYTASEGGIVLSLIHI